MKQLTHKKTIRLSENEAHYLKVLSEKYGVNTCHFIRAAVLEKLKRDVPKIRSLSNKTECPF
jgi:predicted DNA-binding protein